MASQSSNPPSQGNSHQPNKEDGSEPSSTDKLVFEAAQPMRADYVQNAVKFLSHPKVRGSPVMYRRSFLEKKGLTKEEIDEAFRQVPDPQTNAPGVGAAGSQQVQPYNSVQSLQPSTGAVTAGPIVVSTQSKFSLYRTLLAVGLFLGFGAGAAVFIKKLFLPRLKSWIQKVVAEGDETEGKQLKSKIDEETAEAARASASAVSAIAKTNEEFLASKDEEKKILMNLTRALDSQAKELKSLSESINNSRESINNPSEDRFSQYRLLEEHVPSAQRNGSVNSSWRVPQQTNMYGMPNSDFGSGRSLFAPVPAEPTPGSFSRSYVEQTMSTAQQRGDKSSGSQPWEMNQYSQQKLGFGSSSQLSDNGYNSEVQDNHGHRYHLNGDEPRPLSYSTGVEERPQRRWVPPQPPGVVMPEAAAAIRQQKPLPKQPSGNDESEATAAEMHSTGAPPMVSDAVVAELPINGSPMTDAGHSEIEEQSEAI